MYDGGNWTSSSEWAGRRLEEGLESLRGVFLENLYISNTLHSRFRSKHHYPTWMNIVARTFLLFWD